MKRLAAMLVLCPFLAGCYAGESSTAGLVVDPADLGLIWSGADLQCWMDWFRDTSDGRPDFELDEEGCGLFLDPCLLCDVGGAEPVRTVLPSMEMEVIGPAGFELLLLKPSVHEEAMFGSNCDLEILFVGFASEGLDLRLTRVENSDLVAIKQESRSVEFSSVLSGEMLLRGAEGRTLSMRLTERQLRLPAVEATAEDLLFSGLPVGERLSLDQRGDAGAWVTVMEFMLNQDGERLTVDLP